MSASMDQGNRTFIGSVVFVDIVGYSKKSVSDQITMKDRFTALLSEALTDVALEQRIILDTGDGAALSFIGDPEDALFVSMNIRDLLKRQTPDAAEPTDESTSSGSDLFLRIGINLGPIKLVRDINGHPNIVGDGINVAQRIMSFARPGQVVVSRSFYGVVSVISDEYAQLFKYEGSRTDKHVREHEIYVVGDSAAAFNQARSGMVDRAAATNPRNKPAAAGNRKSEKPNKATATESAQSEDAGEALPFLQNKKKLSIIGGALGALVIALALTLAMKKPTPVDPTNPLTADSSAANAMAAANSGAGGGSMPAATKPADAVETSDKPASTTTAPATPVVAVPQTPAKTEPNQDTPKVDPLKASIAQGTLSFAIQPWGEVLVNGKSIGTSPPIKQYRLSPGKHKIEVRNSTFTPLVTTIEVKPKEDQTIRHQFK